MKKVARERVWCEWSKIECKLWMQKMWCKRNFGWKRGVYQFERSQEVTMWLSSGKLYISNLPFQAS